MRIINPTEPKEVSVGDKKEEYNYIKPSHYDLYPGMKDTFGIHKAYLTPEEFIGWLKGTILKYKLRMGEKPGEDYAREMAKINVYRDEMRKVIEEDNAFPL